ncbi:glycosyltransferase family 39 protein [bacterium]|nr:glycosyltransferase family 39 protein [bacterium]
MLSESVTFATMFRDRVFWVTLAVSFAVRLALSGMIGPGFDEAYYHLFARNLAWGYFDHPPAVALIAGLGTWLTGLWTPLTLRLGAVLAFTLTLPGVYLLAGRVYNRNAARFAVLLLHAAPYFLVGAGAFVIPDNALLLAWVWALVVAERLRNTVDTGTLSPKVSPAGVPRRARTSGSTDVGKPGGEAAERPRLQADTGTLETGTSGDVGEGVPHSSHLTPQTYVQRTLLFALLGVFTGLALLAKYHAVLLPASLVIASIYDKQLRRWWLDWRLYLALVIAVLVFAPTIWWNANNHWISFAEQLGKGTSGELRLRFDLIGQAIGGQIGYLTPWLAVVLFWGAFRRRRSQGTLSEKVSPVEPGVPRRTRTSGSTDLRKSSGEAAGTNVEQAVSGPRLQADTGTSNAVPHTSHLTPHTSPSDRWLVAFFLTPVIGITLIGLTRGILPHWTMPGYAAAFVLAAGGFAWTTRVQRNIAIAIGVNLLLVLLVVIQAATGFIPLEPRSDPTLDPAGWRAALDELEQSGELTENDLIFAHKWFTAGELAWADQGAHTIVLLNPVDSHMFAWWAPETQYERWSGVFITQARYDIDPEKHFAPRFSAVEPLPLDSVRHRNRWVRMKAWRLTDLQHPQAPAYGPFAAP